MTSSQAVTLILLRCLTACLLLSGVVFLAVFAGKNVLVAGLPIGLLLHWLTRRPLRRALLSAIPISLSAAILGGLQLLAGTPISLLPLEMVVVFFGSSAAVAITPWNALISSFRPDSHGFRIVLYFHFVRHFIHILGGETLRVLRAWRWSGRGAPRRARFRALNGALSGLFMRCLARAEQFYAAQLVRGLAE